MAAIVGMKGINTMPIGYTVEEKVRPKGDTFKSCRNEKIILPPNYSAYPLREQMLRNGVIRNGVKE